MAEPTKMSEVGAQEILAFLRDESDFAFELAVKRILSDGGFRVIHGGTYVDPHSGKAREFDLRAHRVVGGRSFRLAVECKNVSGEAPVLIITAPRDRDAAQHTVCTRRRSPQGIADPLLPGTYEEGQPGLATLSGLQTPYREKRQVGKSVNQIRSDGRKTQKSRDGDDGIYAKWSQALFSAVGLPRAAFDDVTIKTPHNAAAHAAVIVPLVVIPDGRLWRADFDENGAIIGEPLQADEVAHYVGYNATYDRSGKPEEWPISHIHFMTTRGLRDSIADLEESGPLASLFECDEIRTHIRMVGRGVSRIE